MNLFKKSRCHKNGRHNQRQGFHTMNYNRFFGKDFNPSCQCSEYLNDVIECNESAMNLHNSEEDFGCNCGNCNVLTEIAKNKI